MAFRKFLFAAVTVALSAPAAASVQVVGSSSARLCYEAADLHLNPTMNDLKRCNSAFQEALTFDDTVATYVNRGIILARMGNTDRALDDYNRAIRLDPAEPEAYLNKGAALLRRDQPEAALQHFSLALERNTGRPALAHFGLAIANEVMGNVRQAYQNYRRANELAPDWADPLVELERFQVVAQDD